MLTHLTRYLSALLMAATIALGMGSAASAVTPLHVSAPAAAPQLQIQDARWYHHHRRHHYYHHHNH